VPAEETDGRLIYDPGNRQWNIPELRRLLNEILPDNDFFHGYEVEHVFEGIGRKVMLLNGRRLDHIQLILLSIEYITDWKASEEHQAMLVAELAHRVKNAPTVVQSLAL
jgi:two-component system, chemotaxis family, CheB/CheR fusion protein